MAYLIPSLRLWLVTLLVCVVGYTLLVLAFAQSVAPFRANGSLITVNGRTIGSELIAQNFTSARYFWPRPSAAKFDGMHAAGSNLSPTSEKLTERAAETVAHYGATSANPLPADLVAASGGGLDPHISVAGALYQVQRIARSRNIAAATVRRLIDDRAVVPGGPFAPDPIVNVLQLNLALDRLKP